MESSPKPQNPKTPKPHVSDYIIHINIDSTLELNQNMSQNPRNRRPGGLRHISDVGDLARSGGRLPPIQNSLQSQQQAAPFENAALQAVGQSQHRSL